jgi:hypothetical protein
MKRHSFPVALLLSGTLFTGCEKEANESPTLYGIHYQLTTSNPATVLGTAPTGEGAARMQATVSWKSGSAVARRIRFEAVGDDEVDIRTAVPTQIAMIGPATDLGMITIPAGDYEDARFTIELSATDPFQLTGDYNGTPLVLQIPGPIHFELSEATLSIAARTHYRALTTLNLSRILSGITADRLSEAFESNGQILISPNSNVPLYNIILNNMKNLGELEFGKQ